MKEVVKQCLAFGRDQEEGGELDSHEEVRPSFAGPGEIKWLVPQESPDEIKSREVELGSESWTFFCFSCSSAAVLRTLSL